MMGMCLTDAVNDSCFPKAMGSEPLPLFAPNIFSGLTLFQKLLCTVAIIAVQWCLKFPLAVWIVKYRLRYLWRMSFFTLSIASIMKVLHWFEIVDLGQYELHFTMLWYFTFVFTIVFARVRWYWKEPVNIVKSFEDMPYEKRKQYDHGVRKRVQQNFEFVDITEIPPVFPNGCFPILAADKLLPGELIRVYRLGYSYCVYRGEFSKRVFVLDGYCPHLGADLTADGRVRGDEIECPFHGWKISGVDGSCRTGPGGALPCSNGARAKVWPSRETNGEVYIWHDVEGLEPDWYIPEVEPVCNGEWIYRGRTEHEVHCHIQEIPENGADINHLQQLHAPSVLRGGNWMDTNSWLNLLNHHWQPRWSMDPEKRHMARISLEQTTTFWGFKLPGGHLKIDIEQIGPATVHLHIQSEYGKAILMQYIYPEAPLSMRIIHRLYTEPRFPQMPAEILLRSEAIMFEKRMDFVKSKETAARWLHRVHACPDCPVRLYHRWYDDAFISEHSPTIAMVRDRTMLF